MKIKITDLKLAMKLLEKIPYLPVNEKSKIFFEIDAGKVVDDGTFVVEVKDKSQAHGTAKPGLILSVLDKDKKGNKVVVDLAYALTDYASKFNLETYLDIMDVRLPEKYRKILISYDAYIIQNEAVLAQFEL